MILGSLLGLTSLTSLLCESAKLLAFVDNDALIVILEGETIGEGIIVVFGESAILVRNAQLPLAAATSITENNAFLEYVRIFWLMT